MLTKTIKKIKPHLHISNGVLLVALLITLNWAWGTVGALQNNFSLQQQVVTLQQQNKYYALQNQTLKYQQQYYKTNEYLELQARTTLNKSLPGEKVLLLPVNTVKDHPPADASVQPQIERTNLEQWLYFLFGTPGSNS